jgi:hypothetical protein
VGHAHGKRVAMNIITVPSEELPKYVGGFVTPDQNWAWECELFGMPDGYFTLRLVDGKQPNIFYRVMQRLLLGNRWKRIK